MELGTNLAASAYAANRTATAPNSPGSAAGLTDFAKDFMATLQTGESAALEAMTTRSDPHALVQALAQTEIAVETATTIRNKVVESYQEILRMPV
jgi:flagellar hook-basal body complex protein FliE